MPETLERVSFTEEQAKFLSVLDFEEFNNDYFSKSDRFYNIDVCIDDKGYSIKIWLSDNIKEPAEHYEFTDYDMFAIALKRLVREWEKKR